MSGLLDGKAVLLVGASAGIGADAARVFAEEGARLLLAARSADALAALTDELAASGADVAFEAGDVTEPADVRRFVSATVERFGRLDGAFNNAGVSTTGTVADTDEADFDRLMAVNVKGVWLCLREEILAMRESGGSIVNTSSVGGFRGSTGLGVYPATKHAVIGLTRVAAHDEGPRGIRVNAIAPGPVETPMLARWRETDPDAVASRIERVPLRAAASTRQIADSAVWLLSDRSSDVTGVVLPVDGGFSA